jgi:hypothetical protein
MMSGGIDKPEPDLERSWDEFVKDAHLQEQGMSERAVDSRRLRMRQWTGFWLSVTWGSMLGGALGNLLAEMVKLAVRLWMG